MLKHFINNNEFYLGSEKEMYWPEKKTLILSDLHLGKIKHFSANGIQIPKMANTNNYWRLSKVLAEYDINRVLLLGDLFHSVYNSEWEVFIDFVANYSELEWILIKGNHDILGTQEWKRASLSVCDELEENGIVFTHEPLEVKSEYFNVYGHIHPAVRLKGMALQSLKLPCFYFSKNVGILPAFGEFTGTHVIKPKQGDSVYALGEGELIKIR